MKTTSAFLIFFITTTICYSQANKPGSGYAQKYNGTSDFVYCGDGLNALDVPFTVSGWIKLDTLGVRHPIIVSDKDSASGINTYMGFSCQVGTNNCLLVGYGDGNGGNSPSFRRTFFSTQALQKDTWVHFAGVVRGPQDASIYVNGVPTPLTMSGTGGPMAHDSRPILIGLLHNVNQIWQTWHFKGTIDELSVWDYALSQDEVRKNMCQKLGGSEPGLVGYWRFDEGAGNVAEDSSPNNNDGTLF